MLYSSSDNNLTFLEKKERKNSDILTTIYLRFEKSLPDLSVDLDPGLELGWNGGPGDHGDDEGEAGGLVIRGEEDHAERHQLHAPRDQVEGPVVGGGAHAVDDSEADETGYEDVADHKVEILLRDILPLDEVGEDDH